MQPHLSPRDDAHFMALALEQALLAASKGEVPVGAVVVKNSMVIAAAHNAPISQNDPTAHAEIQALRAAALVLGNYRLDDCELFVTLEPCAMCAGAMLHARLRRIVFGAWEPKSGAAGSVLNLFENKQLNHQTLVKAGVLQARCAQALKEFFLTKRTHAASLDKHVPLRQDALRTPASCFSQLPEYPWQARYMHDLPALDGLRMHYLDEGEQQHNSFVFLCLHGNTTWSYLYRKMLAVWCAAGHRVVVPDLIGFGKSDKPKREKFHTLEFHHKSLVQFIEQLNLCNVVLVSQENLIKLGLTLPVYAPERFKKVFSLSVQADSDDDWAYVCAFPDEGHKAALHAFQPNGTAMGGVGSGGDVTISKIRDSLAVQEFGTVRSTDTENFACTVLSLLTAG